MQRKEASTTVSFPASQLREFGMPVCRRSCWPTTDPQPKFVVLDC